MRILHLGCGRRKDERFGHGDDAEVIALDMDAANDPDIVCRLGRDHIPLPDNSVDQAVAIHVLEHIGRQGETEEWFFFWEDLYRVLRPGGELHFISPLWNSVWAWSDPTHSRALAPQCFVFFDQDNYRIDNSSISPYRIKCDFKATEPFTMTEDGMGRPDAFTGCLKAEKPLKPWWEA